MATLISKATGNLGAAGTWDVVDATSLLDSEAANTALTTSYVASSTFTPGAIVIDGIAVKIASRAASPSGTITVALDQGGSDVAGTPVTINVSDIDPCGTAANEGGWYLFKFAAPVTLAGATAYGVKAKTSSAAQVNLSRNATAGNWSRMLRTTTTGAPAAGDVMHVIGEHTGAGTGNSFTVTNDLTATTDFGAGTDGVAAMTIGKRGTLTYGASAATNYYLKLSGDLIVYSSGALNVGTVATPIPSDATAVLEFDPVADGGMGLVLRNGCTVTMQGNPVTAYATGLTADAAAAATVLAVASTSGWAAGGELAIPSTTRTTTQSETKTILTVDSSVQVTLSAGLTNAHGGGGTTGVVAEVVYLTRNVIVRSATSTIMAYVNVKATANLDADYVRFRYLGENATGKRGIELETTTGSCSINGCSLCDFEDGGIWVVSGTGASVTNNVLWNLNSAGAASTGAIVVPASAGGTITGNYLVGCYSGAYPFGVVDIKSSTSLTFDNNVVAGCNTGAAIEIALTSGVFSFTGNVVHSCAAGIVLNASGQVVTLTTHTIWRNGTGGIVYNTSTVKVFLDTCTLFGNAIGNVVGPNNAVFGYLLCKSCTIRSDATLTTPSGIITTNSFGATVDLIGCTFGSVSAHTTADLTNATGGVQIRAWNCSFLSTTEFSGSVGYGGFFRSHKHDQVSTQFRTTYLNGSLSEETTNRRTASGYAWKMTPTTLGQRVRLPGPTEEDGFRVAVNANDLVTISCWVLKSSAYNGNAPRLVLSGGMLTGIASDVVALAAATTKTITAATNASPIVITSNSHGFSNGDRVLVAGIGGNTAANGMWTVANKTANTFELAGSTGNGAYTSGGTANVFEQLTVTGTPTELGVASFHVSCDGTAGALYCDDFSVSQA